MQYDDEHLLHAVCSIFEQMLVALKTYCSTSRKFLKKFHNNVEIKKSKFRLYGPTSKLQPKTKETHIPIVIDLENDQILTKTPLKFK